ncbi:hypothetical protein AYI70_g7818, partial [Smittium culicis]
MTLNQIANVSEISEIYSTDLTSH